jgi:hypothetical protein
MLKLYVIKLYFLRFLVSEGISHSERTAEQAVKLYYVGLWLRRGVTVHQHIENVFVYPLEIMDTEVIKFNRIHACHIHET